MSQVARGAREPSLVIALRISDATDGRITVFDLCPSAFGDAPLRARLWPTDPEPDDLDESERMSALEAATNINDPR